MASPSVWRSYFARCSLDQLLILDSASRRYGQRPSSYLGLTDLEADVADLAIALLVEDFEREHGIGAYWYKNLDPLVWGLREKKTTDEAWRPSGAKAKPYRPKGQK
jgi:hypothetical protein